MIKGLTGTCGVTVSGGNISLPYISPNSNNPIQGMIRVNNTDLEVFNGTGWQQLPSSYATVSMDQEILDVIQWARRKRSEELEIEILAQTNPTIKDLVEQVKIKQDQIKMVQTLLKSHGNEPVEMMGS
jgi:hypothetical protein